MIPGCLLGLSTDQDGGRRCGENGLPDPVRGVLLHLHAIWIVQRRRNLSAIDAYHLRPVAREKRRGLHRRHCGEVSGGKDLEETFASLREVDLRLNPKKCAFSVPSSKLLGFLVSHRSTEANPEKVKEVEDMSPLQTLRKCRS